MPQYQYLVKNLFTGAVVDELDLYGVYCSRQMNAAGTFQGTYQMTAENPQRNANMLASTAPGLRGLEMQRDGVAIWGGIIWSRSYEAQGQTMSIYANTWESYFDHIVFWKDHFIQQKVLQETIFQNIVTQLQGQSAAANIGLTIPSLPTTTAKRTVLIPNYEFHFGSEAISQVVGVDLGLEYTIAPNKQILVDVEGALGTQSSTPALSFDFPGTIATYWMPESGASGAVKLATLGAGTGNKIVRATSIDQEAINAGYPEWWKVTQYTTIADLGVIQAKNVADFTQYQMPYLTPTFDIKPEANIASSSLNDIGADFHVTIQDIRYPTGKKFTSRMLGWELTPESSTGPESLKISVDGSKIIP